MRLFGLFSNVLPFCERILTNHGEMSTHLSSFRFCLSPAVAHLVKNDIATALPGAQGALAVVGATLLLTQAEDLLVGDLIG